MRFSLGDNDKTSYVILFTILVAISYISRGAMRLEDMIFSLPGVIIAISFHEFAHAWTADKLGDTTPRAQGRLTLDPKAHLDPKGFILLLFCGVGWGKPVQINPNNFTSNKSRQTCEALVSVAGPIMNFILAIIFTVIFYAITFFAPKIQIIQITANLMMWIAIINIGLGVFNLVPLPPLDGEKIFRRFLPYSAIEWLERNQYTLEIVFLILWATGVLSMLVAPIIRFIFNILNNVVIAIFSLF